MKSNRTLALDWWRSLTMQQQKNEVELWKNKNQDFRATWSFEMICMSSSTIEVIWEKNKHHEDLG